MESRISRRQFIRRCGQCALLCAGLDTVFELLAPSSAAAGVVEKGRLGRMLSPYFTALEDNRIRCDLCPRQCEVDPGDRGYCGVRENIDGKYYSLVYGNPCAVHVDPIEKKPLFHVLPGTSSFSIATAGCNFDCKFCQNWEISQADPGDTYNYELSPADVIKNAKHYRCASIASTYVEPTIFMEYMLDVGKLAKEQGILKVMHSNGYTNPKPLDDLADCLAAACIDLKAIRDDYYREVTEGTLEPVLATLKHLKERSIHTEIVNLVLPGKNDSDDELHELSRWIRTELGPDVPLHFSRFYPRYKLKSLSPTPVETLDRARKIAMQEGLHYVYVGNVPGHPGEHTVCPGCGARIIERVGYVVTENDVVDGHCKHCSYAIAGVWNAPAAIA